jgi:hypothetical protein
MNRRETVQVFRDRLGQVIELSQLLSETNDRLPRAETIAAIAVKQSVSVDWLLGLSQEDQLGTNIVTESLEIAAGGGAPEDERLVRWHAEAVGYKVRYVPTTLPDMLKTEGTIAFEFSSQGGTIRDTQIDQAVKRLAYTRRPETDIEACASVQSVEAFVRGEGIWRSIPEETRAAQLDHMIALVGELYPTFRWFLFDGLQRFTVPYTVFGPTRAIIYVGGMYFVFNSTEHIRVLIRHFDELIRAAVIQPPDVAQWLAKLRADLE